jgi:adenine C2-methylase RlmN of 23S rRNA A2503 and tRNA A37
MVTPLVNPMKEFKKVDLIEWNTHREEGYLTLNATEIEAFDEYLAITFNSIMPR